MTQASRASTARARPFRPVRRACWRRSRRNSEPRLDSHSGAGRRRGLRGHAGAANRSAAGKRLRIPLGAVAVNDLADRLQAGDRRALAKAITLVESTRPDHREQADALLTELMPATGRALRLGISGVPGVGKSTFIEAFGLLLLERGHRVAVLAVDPSSSVSGGAILGDKTRMEQLSMDVRAFIRPSPSSGTLGGVAEKTREALLLCEAAGFDVVIVETVGVGQSETAVAGMTDLYVLMQLPNAGDDLQAIKKGVMELADLVVINKADLDAAAATRAQAQITSALRLLPSHAASVQRVLQVSALKADGIAPLWQAITDLRTSREASGQWQSRRREQSLAWMWERLHAGLRQAFVSQPGMADRLAAATEQVRDGFTPPSTAARQLLAAFESRSTAS
ncbi:MAG: methylmalonyl Co-A mutase-associated GTPase MeaB [Rubrivivax sp.]|nr:MAG: methylmalonyl Co-A mutase-associated GTPase MeaB [Rubrivivax sp.]